VSASDELRHAAFDGDLEAVVRLLDAGADVDGTGTESNPLHAAIENENVACIRLLIRRGANVEHRVGGLWRWQHAVDIAVDGVIQKGGSPGDEPTDVICMLLEAGAEPTTALQLARDHGSSKIVTLLSNAVSLGTARGSAI
jgi:ankyrin repeat protein